MNDGVEAAAPGDGRTGAAPGGAPTEAAHDTSAPAASGPASTGAAPGKRHGVAGGADQGALAGMTPQQVVEAALFSAGGPLAVDEIMEKTDLKRGEVEKALKALAAAYAERDTVLEVGKAGAKWAMQVRPRAAEPAARFAPMEIPKKVLKTLALIAYHQPLKQSELVDMVGSKAYDHVGELRERGLVLARQDGVTKSLTTTAAFPEYFGLDAEDTEGVRAAMAQLVGLPPPPPKKKEKPLETFPAPGEDADEAEGDSAPDDAGGGRADADGTAPTPSQAPSPPTPDAPPPEATETRQEPLSPEGVVEPPLAPPSP